MIGKRFLALLYTMALLLGMVDVCGAASYSFDMGDNSSVDTSGTNTVLEMQADVNPNLGDIIFSLEEGESYSFYFATFYTTEGWINNDDLNPGTLIAYVDFNNPDLFQAIGGESIGFSCLWHFVQGWHLTWDDPVVVNFGDDGQFTAELSDVSYSSWFWQGPDGYANVDATITLNSAPVPVPSAILLLASGLAGLAGFGRRRELSARMLRNRQMIRRRSHLINVGKRCLLCKLFLHAYTTKL